MRLRTAGYLCVLAMSAVAVGCEREGDEPPICGDGVVNGTEMCEYLNLAGQSCSSLGLGSGQLACGDQCAFDTSGCSTDAECGNGLQEGTEPCDGTDLAGQTCADFGYYSGSLDCESDCSDFDTTGCSEECGDDVVNGTEVCDGSDTDGVTCASSGYYTGTIGCLADCSAVVLTGCSEECGDDVVNGPETCDGSDTGAVSCASLGFYNGSLDCLTDCSAVDPTSCSGRCGDGVVDTLDGEQCDDASANSDTQADACRTNCLDPICGDGVIDSAEACDDATANSNTQPNACRTDCTLAGCGDGVVDFVLAEQCDDGNVAANDGCDPTCQIENPGACGDGNTDPGETCDDGNTWSGDGCSATCQIEPQICGDGNVDLAQGEQCDDGNLLDGDGCSSACLIEQPPTCGDGVLDIAQNEICDDGNLVNGDGCSDTCQYEPVGQTCGDGTTDAGELCDDSNTSNWDSCNPTCNLTNNSSTFVGQQGVQGSNDGMGAAATLGGFGSLTGDDTYLYYADGANHVVRRIDIATANVVTIAGQAGSPAHVDNAIGANARFLWIESLATDGTTLWALSGCTIRAIDVAAPYGVTTIAGVAQNCTYSDGIGAAAGFDDHRGLIYYGGMLYLLDSVAATVRSFDPVTYEVLTVAGVPYQTGVTDGFGGNARFISPRYMASENSGLLYIADTNGNSIREYNTVTTEVRTFAGDGTQGYLDNVGLAARIHRPRGMCSDGTSLYFSEFDQHTIRQGVLATQSITTNVGQHCNGNMPCTGGFAAGIGSQVQLNAPVGLVFHYPTNSLFVVDAGNYLIRRIQ